MEVVPPVLQHIRLIVKIIQTDAKLQNCLDPSGWVGGWSFTGHCWIYLSSRRFNSLLKLCDQWQWDEHYILAQYHCQKKFCPVSSSGYRCIVRRNLHSSSIFGTLRPRYASDQICSLLMPYCCISSLLPSVLLVLCPISSSIGLSSWMLPLHIASWARKPTFVVSKSSAWFWCLI
jgi:hypothetical protein